MAKIDEWCPPGFQELLQLKTVIFTKGGGHLNTSIDLKVMAPGGRLLLLAERETDLCGCGPNNITVKDAANSHTVLTVENSGNSMVVSAPPGTAIGRVNLNSGMCSSDVEVKTISGKKVFQIDGDAVVCCGESTYQIRSADGSIKYDPISHHGNSFSRDEMELKFPQDLDNLGKMLLFASAFLIDYDADYQQSRS